VRWRSCVGVQVLAIISAVQLGVNHSQDVSIALYAATLVFTVVAAFFLVATGRSGRSSLAVMALVWIVVRAGLVFIGIVSATRGVAPSRCKSADGMCTPHRRVFMRRA
jgi:hypothetical protein